jgi:hypothetical protein
MPFVTFIKINKINVCNTRFWELISRANFWFLGYEYYENLSSIWTSPDRPAQFCYYIGTVFSYERIIIQYRHGFSVRLKMKCKSALLSVNWRQIFWSSLWVHSLKAVVVLVCFNMSPCKHVFALLTSVIKEEMWGWQNGRSLSYVLLSQHNEYTLTALVLRKP